MRAHSIVLLPLVGAAALLSGCGKDSTGPVTPKAIAIVAGDNQTGPGGDDLRDPRRVVVTGSDNRPMAGAAGTGAGGGAPVLPPSRPTGAHRFAAGPAHLPFPRAGTGAATAAGA